MCLRYPQQLENWPGSA